MKYVLMYTNRPDLDAAVPEERRAEVYQASHLRLVREARTCHGRGGAELGPETATTVKYGPNGGAPVVVDGPFTEAKENVGGFSIIDVPDLDAAIAVVKEWPSLQYPGVAVEIRPIVDHSGGM